MAWMADSAAIPPSSTTAAAASPCLMSSEARSAATADVCAISVVVLAVSVTAATCSVVAAESCAAADWRLTTMPATSLDTDCVLPTMPRRLPVIRWMASPSAPATSTSRRRSPAAMVRACSAMASREPWRRWNAAPRSPAIPPEAALSPRESATMRRASSSMAARDSRKAWTSPLSPSSSFPRSPAAMARSCSNAWRSSTAMPAVALDRSPIPSGRHPLRQLRRPCRDGAKRGLHLGGGASLPARQHEAGDPERHQQEDQQRQHRHPGVDLEVPQLGADHFRGRLELVAGQVRQHLLAGAAPLHDHRHPGEHHHGDQGDAEGVGQVPALADPEQAAPARMRPWVAARDLQRGGADGVLAPDRQDGPEEEGREQPRDPSQPEPSDRPAEDHGRHRGVGRAAGRPAQGVGQHLHAPGQLQEPAQALRVVLGRERGAGQRGREDELRDHGAGDHGEADQRGRDQGRRQRESEHQGDEVAHHHGARHGGDEHAPEDAVPDRERFAGCRGHGPTLGLRRSAFTPRTHGTGSAAHKESPPGASQPHRRIFIRWVWISTGGHEPHDVLAEGKITQGAVEPRGERQLPS